MRMEASMLDLICCPNCQGDLVEKDKSLICSSCFSKFHEKDGILILISKELEEELRYG